jgi:hypothetical protein
MTSRSLPIKLSPPDLYLIAVLVGCLPAKHRRTASNGPAPFDTQLIGAIKAAVYGQLNRKSLA